MSKDSRTAGNSTCKAIENEFVEGPHGIPIKKTEETMRSKVGGDGQERLAILRLRLELQPGFAG